MAQSGKGLAALGLIVALIGASAAGFLLIKQYILVPPAPEPYIRPMARVYQSGTYYLLSGATTTFNYTDKSYDTHDAFDLGSDTYEIPEPGFYQVIAQYCIEAEFQDFFKIDIARNGITVSSRSFTAARSTNTFTASIVDIINATSGDLISIRVYSYNGPDDPRLVFAYEDYTFFTIMKEP